MMQGTETVVIVRKESTESDEFGLPVITETQTEIKNVLVSWNGSATTEDLNRVLSTSDITFYFPAKTVIGDKDAFNYMGSVWEMQGTPQYWSAPVGFDIVPGIVVNANRVKG